MVADIRSRMSSFIVGLPRLLDKESKVAMLKGYMSIARLIIHVQQVEKNQLKDREEFENKRAKTSGDPVEILDLQVRKLRTKEVASVKVVWRNQFVEEATWEADEDMKKTYPHLFGIRRSSKLRVFGQRTQEEKIGKRAKFVVLEGLTCGFRQELIPNEVEIEEFLEVKMLSP
ncbi:hypothetical protein MTR67_018511 [Solanum verrucosum]|uniref:Chromo domain-containing protein n=1 Tax=Solanum verrucosum TaxID=315347 RepID=A0AAF0QKT5_SOLVR|nr:hypothetical protein MTR67_018511 [Solanum verrucosum]